jgi:hypothetical protein
MMRAMTSPTRIDALSAPALLALSPVVLVLLALALLALTLLTGCGECSDDYDCPGTRVCDPESSTCEALICRADRDCPPAHTCGDNTCTPTAASPAPDAPDAIIIGPG